MATGHIKAASDGVWRIVLDIGKDPVTGKRRQKWYTVRGTKREAQKRLNELINELNKGILIEPTKQSVADFLRRWLDDYGKANLRPRTLENYRIAIEKHIIPALGATPLHKLQPLHLQRYYTEALTSGRKDGKPGGLSPKSVLYHHSVVHKALGHAVRWQIIARNVADLVDPPKADDFQPYIIDLGAVLKLLSAASKHRLLPLYALAVTTGLRQGELLGLRWEDVDLARGHLTVRQSLYYRHGFNVGEPKTKKGRRLIVLPLMAIETLEVRRRQQQTERELFGADYQETGLVFGTERGTPLEARNVVRHFKTVLRDADLSQAIRFHDLRHAHATLLVGLGVDVKTIQERLGHAEAGTTLDIYSHVTTDMQKSAALKLDQIFRGAKVRNPLENALDDPKPAETKTKPGA